MAALFLYLPPFISIYPEVKLPHELEGVSLISNTVLPPGSLTETKVHDCEVGAYRLRMKTDLIAFATPQGTGKSSSRSVASLFGKDLPETALDIAVEGVRVFKQRGLLIDKSGKNVTEGREYTDQSDKSMYLRGLYVAIDFAREGAPILPSRNALDVESGIREELKTLIEKEFIELLPALVSRIADRARGKRQLRSELIRFFNNVIWTSYRHSSRHPSPEVYLAAGAAFRRWCPLRVQRLDSSDEYTLFSDIDKSTVSVIVLRSVANNDTFPIYARASNLSGWIVADSIIEMRFVQDSWTDNDLTVLQNTTQLFSDFDILAEESRTGELVKLLRGDYALVRSDIFGGKLFFHLPGSSMPQHVGAATRRIDASYSSRPRVMINVEHPLIVAIEHYLANADANGRALMAGWIDSFSDGIIEDKHTRLAPMAHWNKLRDRLVELVGESVSDITFDTLRVEM